MLRSRTFAKHFVRLPRGRWRWLFVLHIFPIGAPQLLAQDIHFSQYFNAPLALGPGTIGTFDGNYRVNVIFRQQ